MLRAKRVLIVGGTQFIGRATVEALSRDGADLTLLNRGTTPCAWLDRLPSLRVVHCDRWSPGFAAFIATEAPWDAIVDFVAFSPDDVEPVIALGPRVGLYIFISSDSVYEASDPAAFRRSAAGLLTENSDGRYHAARASADEYGANKLATELRLREANSLRSLCMRLPDVLGPHENTQRLRKLLLRLVQGKRVGTQIGGEPGAGARGRVMPLGLVFAADVAEAIVQAVRQAPALHGAALSSSLHGAEALSPPLHGADALTSATPVHICSEWRPTWVELVERLAELLRTRGELEVPPVQFDESKDTRFVSVDCGALDGSRASRMFPGWKAGAAEARLEECVDWWLEEMRERFAASERLEKEYANPEPKKKKTA
ncbi:hypothetical protein AB1Y20_006819 [Prymnesium parvum]|uniref:NAD-dependent epimerase/dehydratase domain-containing protein n=1 Tax=Prymnesium parvum TaxID=97485 RepID=A0AB34J1V4_PRYPA